MLVLLSPSKNLHNHPLAAHHTTLPRMADDSVKLIDVLLKQTPKSLQKLMDINDKLAKLNVERYHQFSWPHTAENSTAAMYTFRGEVYLGLEANTLTKAEADIAQKYIRILSGLYGLLQPLDLIQPYRLEMGIELKVRKAKSLYEFWGDRITQLLNEDVAATKSKFIINLASQEYSAAVKMDQLSVPVIDIHFLEFRNDKLQFLSFNAKRSRGWMARYIVQHKLIKSSDLKGFDVQGYGYREDLSDAKKMVFVK
ncbi:MAG: peroxide stress protein YaaA [Bacteroidota bacterium]|nr:peroxide stress protein YaaA [Bacteroidota bacterium]